MTDYVAAHIKNLRIERDDNLAKQDRIRNRIRLIAKARSAIKFFEKEDEAGRPSPFFIAMTYGKRIDSEEIHEKMTKALRKLALLAIEKERLDALISALERGQK